MSSNSICFLLFLKKTKTNYFFPQFDTTAKELVFFLLYFKRKFLLNQGKLPKRINDEEKRKKNILKMSLKQSIDFHNIFYALQKKKKKKKNVPQSFIKNCTNWLIFSFSLYLTFTYFVCSFILSKKPDNNLENQEIMAMTSSGKKKRRTLYQQINNNQGEYFSCENLSSNKCSG